MWTIRSTGCGLPPCGDRSRGRGPGSEPRPDRSRCARPGLAHDDDLAPVVAVAGSNGKTSTKETVASVLERAMPTYRSAGNLNSEIGLGLWRVLDVQRPPFGLKAAWSLDYDVDGWPDLFVANDTQPNKLYKNLGDGRFVDEGLEATKLFVLFRDWLAQQFVALGREADADALAVHLLMCSQGVATLATAFGDEAVIRREVDDMCAWLEAQRPSTCPDSISTRRT